MISLIIAGAIIATMLFLRFKPKLKKSKATPASITSIPATPTTTSTTGQSNAKSFFWSIAIIAVLAVALIWTLSKRDFNPDRPQSQSAPSYAPAPAPIAQIAAEAPAPAPAPEKWELCVKNTCNPITVITLSDSNIKLEQEINGVKVTFIGSGNEGDFTGIWEKDGLSDSFTLEKKSPAFYAGKEQSGKNSFPIILKRV